METSRDFATEKWEKLIYKKVLRGHSTEGAKLTHPPRMKILSSSRSCNKMKRWFWLRPLEQSRVREEESHLLIEELKLDHSMIYQHSKRKNMNAQSAVWKIVWKRCKGLFNTVTTGLETEGHMTSNVLTFSEFSVFAKTSQASKDFRSFSNTVMVRGVCF